jgi:hypothetical protein
LKSALISIACKLSWSLQASVCPVAETLVCGQNGQSSNLSAGGGSGRIPAFQAFPLPAKYLELE